MAFDERADEERPVRRRRRPRAGRPPHSRSTKVTSGMPITSAAPAVSSPMLTRRSRTRGRVCESTRSSSASVIRDAAGGRDLLEHVELRRARPRRRGLEHDQAVEDADVLQHFGRAVAARTGRRDRGTGRAPARPPGPCAAGRPSRPCAPTTRGRRGAARSRRRDPGLRLRRARARRARARTRPDPSSIGRAASTAASTFTRARLATAARRTSGAASRVSAVSSCSRPGVCLCRASSVTPQ